jgi:hypothetical protein
MNVLLSIKPEWAKKILSGEKTIEFRKNFPLKYNLCEDYIFLYATKPICKVIGCVKVDSYINVQKIYHSINKNRDKLLNDITKRGCLSIEKLFEYERNLNIWAWNIKEFFIMSYEFVNRFSPSEKPPQSWCYTNAYLCNSTLNFDHKIKF